MNSLKGLKIAFVAGTLGQGGAERQLYLLCRLLRDAGAEIRVLSLTKGEFWEEKIRGLQVPVVWVGRRTHKIARILAIRKALKQMRPAICQSQHFYTNIYVALACKGLDIIDLGAVRSNLHLEMESHNWLLCKWSLQWPSLILANSHQAIESSHKYGSAPEHFRYFPNIVAPKPESEFSAKSEPPVILGVGRLVALKHWHVFLQIISDLNLQGRQVRGVLVGDGPQRGFLESLAAKLNLDDSVLQFAGAVADVQPFYQEASVFLATSSLEGMPNTVMEAMACGLPVVTTRVGGVAELIQHGRNGYLTEVDATASLREHCSKLLRDIDLRHRIGQAAKAAIIEKHAPDAVGQYLRTLYEELLD